MPTNMHGMYGGGMPLGGLFGMGLGPVGPVGGMLGMGGHQSQQQLEARIEIIAEDDVPADDYVLVFMEAAIPGAIGGSNFCDPASQGAVMTEPVSQHDAGMGMGMAMGKGFGSFSQGFGHASPFSQGFGHANPFNQGFGYANPFSMLGGGMSGSNRNEEYGVMATLTVHPGSNIFEVKGLGPFTTIVQLAGRWCAVCSDVMVGTDGKLTCLGLPPNNIAFCARLGYSMEEVSLQDVFLPGIDIPIS